MIDEHDETLQEERNPTWHAHDVVIERARRAGAPVLLTSPCPTVVGVDAAGGAFVRLSVDEERAGWPIVEIVDRSDEEPCARRSCRLLSSALSGTAIDGWFACTTPRGGHGSSLAGRAGRCCAAPVATQPSASTTTASWRADGAPPGDRQCVRSAVGRDLPTCVPGSPDCARSWKLPPGGLSSRSPDETRVRYRPPTCMSVQRRCSIVSRPPMSSRCWTSIASCWHRVTVPLNRRWRCSPGRRGCSDRGGVVDG